MKRFALTAFLLAIASAALLAASEPAGRPEPDPRLDEKVTIKAVGMPLSDLFSELLAQTGVRFNARKDAADIKVVVLVKDVPLSSLKDSLRDCLHLMCTREGKKGEWTYQFWEDLKTRQDAEGVRQEQVKKLRAHVEKLGKVMADIEAEGKDPAALPGEVNALTAAQREKLAHEDPDRYAAYYQFQSPGALATLTAYSCLSRGQLQTLWAGQPVTICAQGMTPVLGEKFLSRTSAWTNEMRSMHWRFGDSDSTAPDTAECITLNVNDSQWNNKPALFYTLAGAVTDEAKTSLVSIGGSCISFPTDKEEAVGSPPDKTEEPDDRPVLKLEITPKTHLYGILEQVHDLTGICFIADYYTRIKQGGVIAGILSGDHPPFKTGEDVMKQAAKDVRADLSRVGDILILSSKSWPSDRDREIPERLLAKWRDAWKKYGGLRIQEAIELANLNRLQLEDLELYRVGYGWAIINQEGALRLAGSLSSSQWQAAMSEQGLHTSEMSDAQLALIRAWARGSEDDPFDRPIGLSEELSDPQRLRSCVLTIRYKARGEKDDDVTAMWDFALYPPSYFEAIRKGAEKAADSNATITVPAPECRGHLHLPSLNQERGRPLPPDAADK